jgi:hypothetical protein
MDQYITVTSSDQRPCDFVSNFADTISLNDGYEVAVTRIYHAPSYNITETCNTFTLMRSVGNYAPVSHSVPVGFYATSTDVLKAIYENLKKHADLNTPSQSSGTGAGMPNVRPGVTRLTVEPNFTYKASGEASYLEISQKTSAPDRGIMFKTGEASPLLKVLGFVIEKKTHRIDINHYTLRNAIETGFLYSNIVANSMVNQQQSRLLALVPIQAKIGYNFHEVINPVYNPLSVHSFTDVGFTLTNVRGEIMRMDTVQSSKEDDQAIKYPTIITLHIRKIYK